MHTEERDNAQGKDLHGPMIPSPPISPVPPFILLIDADNTPVDRFSHIMQQIEAWGIPTIRRVYGNQETLLGQKWKDLCLYYALRLCVHIGISGAKNATDIALTVDAMDLLWQHADRSPQFCLVTGDQDFTALVLRLRSQGCKVYGIGRTTKAEALAKVCTRFLPIEQFTSPLTSSPQGDQQEQQLAPAPKPAPAQKQPQTQPKKLQIPKESKVPMNVKHLLTQAAETIGEEKNLEWILVSQLGSRLKQLDEQFQAKNYGYKNLQELIKSQTELFECRLQGAHLEVHVLKKPKKNRKKK